ncbi:PPE family protein [Mycobacterium shinjukuense]|nr:PPE family protein [Mycobacterium shinjukuense]
MYAGPGSGSLLAAAAAWTGLAADLHAAAAGYRSVISGLTSGPWLGPASAALVSAAAPYVAWLDSSAEQAELAASQAAAAAAAHEAAFALTVPPPVIAANRALLASLIATNILGQNTAAIATTEAEYVEMWAQDAAAMYGYASASAAAATLTDFEEPAEVTNPAGLAGQAAAVAVAEASCAPTGAPELPAGVHSAVTGALKTLAAPFSSSPIDDLIALYTKYCAPFMPAATSTAQSTNAIVALAAFMKGLAPAAASAVKAAEGAAQALGAATSGIAGKGAGVAASLGRALPLGALSVPPSWAPVTAVTNPALAALTSAAAAPAAADGIHPVPMTPFGPMFGSLGGRNLPTYGFKPAVMARPPAAG